MRALVLTLLLLTVSGCHKNREVLLARQVELDLRLANAMALADNLNEQRKAMDALHQQVQEGLVKFPDARAADDEPLPPVAAPPPLPPLPPESAFEGAEGARLRDRIRKTEARLAALNKVIGEVERIAEKERQLRHQLDRINKLAEQQK
jgi:hypothetical protein